MAGLTIHGEVLGPFFFRYAVVPVNKLDVLGYLYHHDLHVLLMRGAQIYVAQMLTPNVSAFGLVSAAAPTDSEVGLNSFSQRALFVFSISF